MEQARVASQPETPAEKVLHFSRERPEMPTDRAGAPKRDFSAALDLVNEACEAIRMAETRAATSEAYADQITNQFNEQMKTAERRILAAEKRAELAELRAREAEEWLERLHDAIIERFQSALRISQ